MTATVAMSGTRPLAAGGCSAIDVIDNGASYAVGIRRNAGSRSTVGAVAASDANASCGSVDESNRFEPISQSLSVPAQYRSPKLTFTEPRACAQSRAVPSNARESRPGDVLPAGRS